MEINHEAIELASVPTIFLQKEVMNLYKISYSQVKLISRDKLIELIDKFKKD
jgi:hypothetical protein